MTNLDQEIRLQMFSANAEALVDVPFGGSLRAGFPSPAQDYTSEAINLGKILAISRHFIIFVNNAIFTR